VKLQPCFCGRSKPVRHIAGVISIIAVTAFTSSAYRYGFIAGQNRGGSTVSDLHYAENDAKRFATLLQEYAGVAQKDIQLVLHPDSTVLDTELEAFIARIAATPDPEHALLFFFYSGHADGDGLLLDSTHMAFSTLHSRLSNAAAGIRLVILDACQSGAIMAFKGGKRAEPFFMETQQKTRGEVWIASSSANERAQESETLKGSLFSFHLFNGLRGSADVSNDNKVTVAEAYQYAYRKTLETSMLTSGIVQHPVYRFNITGEGDIVLTDLSERRGGILVDGSCSGTFLIMSRDYTTVFADFSKEEGREMFIALPSGAFTIINARGGTDIGLYRFSLSGKKSVRCSKSLFAASLVQDVRTKGVEVQPVPVKDPVVQKRSRAPGLVMNGGVGAALYSLTGNDYWRSGLSYTAHAGMLLRERLLLGLSCSGIPAAGTLLGDIVIERRFNHPGGYYFFGGGLTVEWLYGGSSMHGSTVGAGGMFEGGIVFSINDAFRIGTVIPWRYTTARGGSQSVGIALRCELFYSFGGKRRAGE
jgi:hypothetical protein